MRRSAIFAFVASFISGAGGAQAHAFLDHASPPVGGTVGAAPSVVSLWFTQNLEPVFTSAEVVNAAGARVSSKARIDGANSLMQVGLRPLPPGIYTVRWRTLSVDTHTTEGTFTFQVGQ